MIYVTGDTHGDIDSRKFTNKRFPQQRNLTKDDYLIICGDFGYLWWGNRKDLYWIQWLSRKPWTTLFIDGNHENFDIINEYPVSEWNGGKIHKITDSIFHLMRGQIFNLCGKTFFTMGGAVSYDKKYRSPGTSWWPQEVPSYEEFWEAQEHLRTIHSVDYILTHDCPSDILPFIGAHYKPNAVTEFLNTVYHTTNFKHWYFGHHHKDIDIDAKMHCVYHNIILLEESL